MLRDSQSRGKEIICNLFWILACKCECVLWPLPLIFNAVLFATSSFSLFLPGQYLQALEKVFAMLDRNQSGTLDPTEVHKLIRNIPNLQIADHMLLIAFLYEADINEDGNLSFQELQEAFDSDMLPSDITDEAWA